jgi:hypothetical protein
MPGCRNRASVAADPAPVGQDQEDIFGPPTFVRRHDRDLGQLISGDPLDIVLPKPARQAEVIGLDDPSPGGQEQGLVENPLEGAHPQVESVGEQAGSREES